jgi:hypothetical protein
VKVALSSASIAGAIIEKAGRSLQLMPNENGSNRLDRIEHALELLIDDHVQFQVEHKQLLTAQIVLTDRLDKLAQAVSEERKATAERFKEAAERSKETDEKLNALIKIVDEMIRNRPQSN